MSNTQLPTTQADMVAYVDSQIDSVALQAAIEQAHADSHAAQAKLLAARQALAAHEASSPDADPQAWANTRRQLVDTLPVFERIAADKANALASAQAALLDARRRVMVNIDQQVKTLTSDALAYAWQRVDELRSEIADLQGGRFPQFEHAANIGLALRLAESYYRTRIN